MYGAIASAAIGAAGAINSVIQGNKDLDQQRKMAEQSLAFSKQQMRYNRYLSGLEMAQAQEQNDYFKRIFGSAIENRANYINSLDPAVFERTMNAKVDEHYKESLDTISKYAAQRGIEGSGIQNQNAREVGMQAASTKADNYLKAEEYVAGQKAQFANLGIPAMQNANSQSLSSYNAAINANSMDTQNVMSGYENLGNYYAQSAKLSMADVSGASKLLGLGLSNLDKIEEKAKAVGG